MAPATVTLAFSELRQKHMLLSVASLTVALAPGSLLLRGYGSAPSVRRGHTATWLFTKEIAFNESVPASVMATVERLQREVEECIVDAENWFEIDACREAVQIKPLQKSPAAWEFGTAAKAPDTDSMSDFTQCAIRDFMECVVEAESAVEVNDCESERELDNCALPSPKTPIEMGHAHENVSLDPMIALGSAEHF